MEKQLEERDERIQAMEAENAKLKQKSRRSSIRFEMTPENEARTRQLIIDVMLQESGWNPHGNNVREFEVQGMPNRSGHGYCDYVLWSGDELPLAVIEVKRTMENAEKGKEQAVLYADQLQKKYGHRPILFYTNGYETWMWDEFFYPPRRVSSFYSKEDLEWTIQKRTERKETAEYKINRLVAGRLYQIEAIKRVAAEFEKGRRRALLVMATGTGKTRTAIALVDFFKRA